ncbi:hypothetical protein SteCoe_12707 [Stentor coeruleus]|uniref:Uncharacterized protein n=1 Tax=Stentor coeruleus TaxID=5963 RepID=A0A1R2CA30_9CILI|nr:hypothetical protein SteCoe_12707 [Stentor coeruleus]
MESEVATIQAEEQKDLLNPMPKISETTNKTNENLDENQPESSPIQTLEDLPTKPSDLNEEKPNNSTGRPSLNSKSKLSKTKSAINFKGPSLLDREVKKKSKQNFYRQKCRASQISEVHEVPQVNKKFINKLKIKKTKKINMQKAKKKAEESNINVYDQKIHDTVHDSVLQNKLKLKECNVLTPDTMKESLKIRSSLHDIIEFTEDPGHDVITRSKVFIDRKQKEIAEKRKSKESLELAECSFKPFLYSKSPRATPGSTTSKIIKQVIMPNSARAVKSKSISALSVAELSSRVPPPCKSMAGLEKSNSSLGVLMVSDKYFQLSPFTSNVKYKTGFNQEGMIEKGQFMVNYKLMGNQPDN